ncbi:MAG: molybdopterin molybdotransferase MoeA [Gemmatimonadaceae bacterium]|nr:molybdopterin molybdotransferase MoeA [Gemmatimonadaceae bacterium]
MLRVEEAAARVVADIVPLAVERVPLREAAGRVLAEDVLSPVTLPHWTNSAMDGYAVRAADVRGAREDAPVTLPVLETVAAGAFPTRALAAGEATRIMTGAPVPEGADSVVRVEDTDGGTTQVRIVRDRDAGKNLRPRGEDLHEGQRALAAGTPIGAAQVGVLASIGQAVVPVHRRPRVAILGSGDELVDLDRFDEVRAGRRIVSSNAYTLEALVRANGGEAIPLGHARDTREAMEALLAHAVAARPDLIVTSAGVSVGAHDHTRAALEAMGAVLDFWKVRMRPGAPIGFGRLAGIPWIGLPGNPVSAMVTFELFARPVLRRMLGHARLHRRPVPVVLLDPVTLHARLTHFLRAVVAPGADGRLTARLTGPQGSGILTSMAQANALLIVPEDPAEVPAGATLSALLLTEDAGMADAFAL